MRKALPLIGLAAMLGLPADGWSYSPRSANSPLFRAYNKVNSWGWEETLPAGLYSFNAGEGSDALAIAGTSDLIQPHSATYHDGKYYVVEVISNWFSGDTAAIYVYDTSDWSLIEKKDLPFVPAKGLSLSPDGKKILFIQSGFDCEIVSIDLDTLESATVAEIPSYLYYTDLCVEPDGNVLTFNSTDGHLYRTDIATGETRSLGDLPDYTVVANSSFYDSASNLVYYAITDESGDTRINSVDPASMKHSDLGPIPSGISPIGLFLPACDGGVPAAVSEISFEYSAPGATDATLTFTMPTETVGHQSIAGSIDAVVAIDGNEETVASNAGEKVVVNKTLTQGNHTFSIFARNNAGLSPERRFVSYCGTDLPREVGELMLEIDENGVATVSWTAPSGSQNGGAFDASKLVYDVIREPNSVVVAEGIAATEFSEQLSDAYARYYYRVIPRIGDDAGLEARTDEVKWGSCNVPPFVEDFEDWYEFGERFIAYTPLDNGYGWNAGSGNAMCMPAKESDADYWLFTPEIRLKAGVNYTLSFDTEISDWEYKSGLMEVYIATDADPDAAEPLMERFLFPYGESSFHKAFKVGEDGLYRIAFRDVTAAGGPQLALDNIGVKENASADAPAAVTGLKAEAGAKGALNATITFNAASFPVKVVNLTTGDEVAATSGTSVTDSNAAKGYNTYEVYTAADDIKGASSFVRVYVGTGLPAAPADVKGVWTSEGKASISWTAVPEKGVNGGYVDPASVTYTVNRYDELDGYYAPEVGSYLTATNCDDDSFLLPEDGQAIVRYTVHAVTEEGEGPNSSTILLLGNPYEAPFAESMAGAEFSNTPWATVSSNGAASWSINNGEATTVQPYDADGGMLMFADASVMEATADFRSPRISVKGAKSPGLSFFMNHGYDADPEDLTLSVFVTADDGDARLLGTIDYNNGSEGWTRHGFDLSEYAANDNIFIDFRGYAIDGSAPIFIDNIRIAPTYDSDIEVSGLSIDGAVEVGDHTAAVDVSNLGKKKASFSVVLYKNDEAVSSEDVDGLEPGQSLRLNMDMAVTLADAACTLTYRAEAVMEGDEDTANNTSMNAETLVKAILLPTVEIEGETEGNTVSISWEKPEAKTISPATDDFEDYSAYAINNFGGWITYDADGKETEFSKFWNQVTNAKAPMAFEVWDNEQAEKDGFFESVVNKESFETHSGSKALITFSAVEQDPWFFEKYPTANDNWLISPATVGATDIEFFVKGFSTAYPETIEVLWTELDDINAENPETGSFELLGAYSIIGGNWRSIRLTLPAAAKRFAIRHTTQSNSSHLMIDDISYVPAEGSTKDIVAKGYNVYRDGKLIASTADESFTEVINEKGVYVYNVTTLWEEGESALSNRFYAEVDNEYSGVKAAEAEGASVKAGAGYIEIAASGKATVAVATTDGTVVFNSEIDGAAEVRVDKGIYIVKVNGTTVKVNVR